MFIFGQHSTLLNQQTEKPFAWNDRRIAFYFVKPTVFRLAKTVAYRLSPGENSIHMVFVSMPKGVIRLVSGSKSLAVG